MKTITRSNICLTMASVILSVAIAIPAAAQQSVPFKGAIVGVDADIPSTTPGSLVVATGGTGTATNLGNFYFIQVLTVDLAHGTATGSAHWIAATGDSLYTTISASGEPTGKPNEISITDKHTITVGTGRFAGAKGSFTVERLASPVTFETSGSIVNGTITLPGGAH
jgi:hypothetical protein